MYVMSFVELAELHYGMGRHKVFLDPEDYMLYNRVSNACAAPRRTLAWLTASRHSMSMSSSTTVLSPASSFKFFFSTSASSTSGSACAKY